MEFNKKNLRTIILIVFVSILFYLGIKNIGVVAEALGYVFDLLFPFILGAGIAFVLNVPMTKIEGLLFKKRRVKSTLRRAVSFILTLVLVFGIIVIAMYVIIPQVAETMQNIATQLPEAIKVSQEWIKSKMSYWEALQRLSEKLAVDWDHIASQLSNVLKDAATGLLNTGIVTVTGIINTIVSVLIGFVFAVYILMSKESLARQGKQVIWALFRKERAEKILYVCELSNKTFSRFISGQCLDACILGIMFFIVMSIIGLPYAMLIAVLITLTALIPIVGAFIGCALGALLILMVNPMQALIFVITFLVLQQVEGNLVYPHIVGNSVGLPSIWVLVAITVGGSLMGIAGMIIFIPLMSVLYSLFRLYVKNQLYIKGVPEAGWTEPITVHEEVMVSNNRGK